MARGEILAVKVADIDTMMDRINAGIALVHGGQRETARGVLADIWREIELEGEPFHRCVLAHFMADVQDEPRDELVWDLRALAAAESLSDGRVKAHDASMSLPGFFPSLHLNVGEAYRKVGDSANARKHLEQAQRAVNALDDAGGYMTTIRGGIARLAERLDGTP
jgi:hypothetical protein